MYEHLWILKFLLVGSDLLQHDLQTIKREIVTFYIKQGVNVLIDLFLQYMFLSYLRQGILKTSQPIIPSFIISSQIDCIGNIIFWLHQKRACSQTSFVPIMKNQAISMTKSFIPIKTYLFHSMKWLCMYLPINL